MANTFELPEIPPDDLPDGLPVDPRVFTHINKEIGNAIEDGRAIFLTNLQLDILVTYARYCDLQKISMRPNLAAGAYHSFQTRSIPPECEELHKKMSKNDTITDLESKFRTMIATSTQETGVRPSTEEKEYQAPERQSYITEMQEALKVGNYDSAIDAAELALGTKGGPSPEALVSAGICFHMRALKGQRPLGEKVDDMDRAVVLFQDFLLETKNNEHFAEMQAQVKQRMKLAVSQRKEISKKIKGGN